jgi:isopropylmalate/homocitrate/citramalate synthase
MARHPSAAKMPRADIIFDWNELSPSPAPRHAWDFFDETLRDGLQSPSVVDPLIEEKLALVELMHSLGILAADIGLPGAGKRAFADVCAIARHIQKKKLAIEVCCAGRTVIADLKPIVEASQKTGMPFVAYAFIGSSPIRQWAEDWSLEFIEKQSIAAIDFAVKEGLEVAFVTEDTTRSRPQNLAVLFRAAIEHGARRLVLSDTVGHATPDGTRALVQWTHNLILTTGEPVKIDWHGHNDRGLALALGLYAFEWGFDRVHGCGLGIGERVGNTSMDLLLLNLYLLGQLDAKQHDLSCLVEYVEAVSEYTGVPIHPSYPLSGRDAFRTATGVHAAAVIKAEKTGDHDLADRVYSSVPARVFGRQQEIEIGHYSGRSNVLYWLRTHGYEPSDELVDKVFNYAKLQNHTLSTDEVKAVIAS